MRNIDEDTITQAVIAAHAGAGDERLRELMTCLVQHLHAFAREVRLTESEWAHGLAFLSAAARSSDAHSSGRGELALLSDTLGLTMLVTALNQRKPRGCTEATVPEPTEPPAIRSANAIDAGGTVATTTPSGDAVYVRGRVHALDGSPIENATVHFWQANASGRYDGAAAGRIRTDAQGRFLHRTAPVEPYAVAQHGPVGDMLRALGRQPWRPAHLHVSVAAFGFERLETHLFRAGSLYLDADASFAVRRSLVVPWVRHEGGTAPDGSTGQPFYTVDYDFVLNPVRELARA
jgi:hydroxyquinol 1,2-dioxygenase